MGSGPEENMRSTFPRSLGYVRAEDINVLKHRLIPSDLEIR